MLNYVFSFEITKQCHLEELLLGVVAKETYQHEHEIVDLRFDCSVPFHLGAIQKLHNGKRGEGVDDFVTYRYVYIERGRVFYETVT